MGKDGLCNSIRKGKINGKSTRGNKHTTQLMSMSECIRENGLAMMAKRQKLLKDTKDRKVSRAVIANVLK